MGCDSYSSSGSWPKSDHVRIGELEDDVTELENKVKRLEAALNVLIVFWGEKEIDKFCAIEEFKECLKKKS